MAIPQPDAGNELVMSNEQIAETLANDTPEAPLDVEAPDLGMDDASDDDGRRPWEDAAPGEELDAETDTPAKSKTSKAIREIKANGKTHTVDMSDQNAVDQLLSLGIAARQVFTDRDKLSKTVKAKDSQISDLQKYKDLWNKLEARKNDKEGLYEQIFGEKWADAVAAAAKQQAAYENASPEERRWMDYQKQLEQQKKMLADQQRDWEAKQTELQAKQHQAELKELRGQMLPEFSKYEFTSKVKDQNLAEKLNKSLWRLTIADLKERFGDSDEIPGHEIRKAFRDTHDMLWASQKTAAKQEVKQVVDKKKAAARQQAQQASTRNYSSSKGDPNGADLAQLAKDPVKLMRRMFGRR